MSKKHYSGTTKQYEDKLFRVMERLGVTDYNYDWNQTKAGASCWVEMAYGGRRYRFENDEKKSSNCGRGLKMVSDLLASIVLSLEGLARATEQGIFSLDDLLSGVPALPSAVTIAPCFRMMGFDRTPTSEDEIKTQYKQLAKVMHPDGGGSEAAFAALTENYEQCLAEFRNSQ